MASPQKSISARVVPTVGGRGVQIHEPGVAGRLSVAVRHADDDGLLQPEHITEVRRKIPKQRQLGRARVAENRRHAKRAEQAQDGVAHRCLRLGIRVTAIIFCSGVLKHRLLLDRETLILAVEESQVPELFRPVSAPRLQLVPQHRCLAATA
jgi:hypothetical protein